MESGAQCVMMDGTSKTLKWSAKSWDIRELLPLMVVLTLDKEMVPFGWVMSSVQEEKTISIDVLIMVGGPFNTAVMNRMPG